VIAPLYPVWKLLLPNHVTTTECVGRAMIEVARLIRSALPEAMLMIQANAGLPKFANGQTVYPEDPAYMASHVGELVRAGANIVGGCCGTTPEHIRAIVAAIRS